jgi:hypothetical protein
VLVSAEERSEEMYEPHDEPHDEPYIDQPSQPSAPPASTPPSTSPSPVMQGAQVQLFSTQQPQEVTGVSPPSYIQPASGGSEELEVLTEALQRCGLPPWRVNTYAEGEGKILWLSNGAHIDLTPSGEVTLGGESQEDTRARLARVGIVI